MWLLWKSSEPLTYLFRQSRRLILHSHKNKDFCVSTLIVVQPTCDDTHQHDLSLQRLLYDLCELEKSEKSFSIRKEFITFRNFWAVV